MQTQAFWIGLVCTFGCVSKPEESSGGTLVSADEDGGAADGSWEDGGESGASTSSGASDSGDDSTHEGSDSDGPTSDDGEADADASDSGEALADSSGDGSDPDTGHAGGGTSGDGETGMDSGSTGAEADGAESDDTSAPSIDTGTASGEDTIGGGLSGDGIDDDDADTSPPYNEAIFRATHNSYSGHERGSIRAQLDAGIRQVEFDFHDNDYATEGFRLGHRSVGSEVETVPPNPTDLALSSWLEIVSDWSEENTGHTPIHVLLNIKDDMTDNRRTDEGSFAALNRLLVEAFGERLFWARNLGDSWPTVNELRGQIIVGLTGRETTSSRRAYVRDRGVDAAVAMNDRGQIIEVHKSESHNTLWFWTGQAQDDGSVIWHHHGQYDNGRNPSIALNNDGWFVEVHRSQSDNGLWSWVGKIGPSGDLEFYTNARFDSGRRPTIDFLDLDGLALREIHESSSEDDVNWDWATTLDTEALRLDWGSHDRTEDARYDVTRATSDAGTVTVWSEDELDDDTLMYRMDTGMAGRIRYAQVAFIDTSPGDPDVLVESSPFRSFPSGSHAESMTWFGRGGISRIWSFDSDDAESMGFPPNFAATDTPYEDWYVSWGESVGAYD